MIKLEKLTWNSISVAGDDSTSWDVLAHSVHICLVFAEVLLLRASDGADEGDSRPVRVVDVHQSLADSIGELILENSLSGSLRSTTSVEDDLFWLRSAVSGDKLPDQELESSFEGLVVDDRQTRILVVNVVHVLRATLRSRSDEADERWIGGLGLCVRNRHSNNHYRLWRFWKWNVDSPVLAAELGIYLEN